MEYRKRIVKGYVFDGVNPVIGGKIEGKLTKPISYTDTHVSINRPIQVTTESNGYFEIGLWCDEDSVTPVDWTLAFPVADNGQPSTSNTKTFSLVYGDGTPIFIGTVFANSETPSEIGDNETLVELIDERIEVYHTENPSEGGGGGNGILIQTFFFGSDGTAYIDEPIQNAVVWEVPYPCRILGISVYNEFPTTGVFTVDMTKNGESMLSTLVTIENNKRSSLASGVQPVIATETAGKRAIIGFDFTDVGDGIGAGCQISILYRLDNTIADEPPSEESEPAAALFAGESSASPNTDGTYTLTGTYNGKPFWNKSGGSPTVSSISFNSTANQWEMYFAWGALAWVRPVGEESPLGIWGTYDFPLSGCEVTEL